MTIRDGGGNYTHSEIEAAPTGTDKRRKGISGCVLAHHRQRPRIDEMKLLWLGSSNDINPQLPEEARVPSIAATIIEEMTGDRPELTVRAVWPNEAMPGLVADWVERFEPDMVCFYFGSYYYSYRSVPLRVQRLLGPLGKPVAAAGFRAAESPRLEEHPAFHTMRRLALRTIGGDTHFTFEQVIDRYEAAVRRILAMRENTVLLVRGPSDEYPGGSRQTSHRRVTKLVEEMCVALHVSFLGWDDPPYVIAASDELLGDGMHYDQGPQAFLGKELERALSKAWLVVHGDAPGPCLERIEPNN